MTGINYTKLKLSGTLLNTLSKRFIAFDTETTGLDPLYNRVIEVGAVLFENGKPVSQYGSLIHSTNYVPYDAWMVNHISDAMVKSAPEPEKVYPELLSFLGDAIRGDTVLVGHNATFDMKFLSYEMRRLGESMDVIYADTCSLSKTALPALDDHKQDTVARALCIGNKCAHRAVTDAETCGRIMVEMIPRLWENEKIQREKARRDLRHVSCEPDEQMQEICRALIRRLQSEELETGDLCFQKSGSTLHVHTIEPLLGISLGKHPYIVAQADMFGIIRGVPEKADDPFSLCSSSEARLYGEDAQRLKLVSGLMEQAEDVLVCSLRKKGARLKKMMDEAEQRWNFKRDREIFWQIEP